MISQPVKQILTDDGKAVGVVLEGGEEVRAKVVLSNATPKVTFLDLLPEVCLLLVCMSAVMTSGSDSRTASVMTSGG